MITGIGEEIFKSDGSCSCRLSRETVDVAKYRSTVAMEESSSRLDIPRML